MRGRDDETSAARGFQAQQTSQQFHYYFMSGYWRSEAETSAVLVDGWYNTGDIGYRDADDFFWIVDRSKCFGDRKRESAAFKASRRCGLSAAYLSFTIKSRLMQALVVGV